MRNLEAKFALRDLSESAALAANIGFTRVGSFDQRDTFFEVPHGRLKLREEAAGSSLIHYRRSSSSELELSDYSIVPIVEAAATRAMLVAAVGILAEVRKRRTLFMRRRIRLHLDEVANLGSFGEIEAVLEPAEQASDYQCEVRAILATLKVGNDALIERSYFELLLARS
jgi:predicted adenylyl cyclase CyaB